MARPPKVIDGHCHLASSRCIPREFFVGVATNIVRRIGAQGAPPDLEKVIRMLILQYEDHQADRLVAKMDEAGIDKTVLLAPDFSYVFESEYTMEDVALQHAGVRERHPGRFHVFFGVDPRWGSAAYDFFEKTVSEYGFEGLKVYPPCGFSPSDERMFPLYEICSARGLPVLLHTGPTTPTLSFDTASPSLIDVAAKRFPRVNFILAHGGVNFAEEAKLMCNYRPNVYLDISGFPAGMFPQGWRAHLAELFSQNINHKIIFGSDWPVFSMKEDLKAMTSGLLDEDGPMRELSPSVVAGIMAENIQGLLPGSS
ncbi:MAG: amidohydrolase family protein [Pseudomonadota bacterium]|nr:amidohydrolase family protein [Pseudomonadota bacterium]